ncbi:hypothetical protein C7B79_26595, partial [Chroococcidiopsis cubana CCALA 043]
MVLLQTTEAQELEQAWRSRLASDCLSQSTATRESILRWLLGEDLARYDNLTSEQLEIAKQAISYRYSILQHFYLNVSPQRGYRHLIQRLASVPILRRKIRALVTQSCDRQRTVIDFLQEILHELLQRDRYMQQQVAWIAKCTSVPRLRNLLLFASLEEYCLRPIRNQPLISYRIINYLHRSKRGGLTQLPKRDFVKLVSGEDLDRDSDSTFSWLDGEAIATYRETQAWETQQVLRHAVRAELSRYLEAKVDTAAVQWLQLYLQGWTQQAIATHLNLDVCSVYRLR